MTVTVLERLIEVIEASLTYDHNVQVAPTALLWPDRVRQWEHVVKRVRDKLPVFTFGDLDASQDQGPAYWIRCAVAGTLGSEVASTPVVYLPGIAREDLRAVEDIGTPTRMERTGRHEVSFKMKIVVSVSISQVTLKQRTLCRVRFLLY
jgi:hypothetical protein